MVDVVQAISRFSTGTRGQLLALFFVPEIRPWILRTFPGFRVPPLPGLGPSALTPPRGHAELEAAVEELGIKEELGSSEASELDRGAPGDLDGLLNELLLLAPDAERLGPDHVRYSIDSHAYDLVPEHGMRIPAFLEVEVLGRHVISLRTAFRRRELDRASDVNAALARGESVSTAELRVTPESSFEQRSRALLLARSLLVQDLQWSLHLPQHAALELASFAVSDHPGLDKTPFGLMVDTFALDSAASTGLGRDIIVGSQGVFRRSPIQPGRRAALLAIGVHARRTERLVHADLPDAIAEEVSVLTEMLATGIAEAMPAIRQTLSLDAIRSVSDRLAEGSDLCPGDAFAAMRNHDDVEAWLNRLALYGCVGHTLAHAVQDLFTSPRYAPLALAPSAAIAAPEGSPAGFERWLRDALPDLEDAAPLQMITGKLLSAPTGHEAGRRRLARKHPVRDLPARIMARLGEIDAPIQRVSLSPGV